MSKALLNLLPQTCEYIGYIFTLQKYFLTGHQCELSDYLENSPKFRNFVGCFVSTLYLTYVDLLFTISSVARALFGTEKITGFTVESIKQFGIVDINEPKV